MSDGTSNGSPIPGLYDGGDDSDGPAGPVTRLARAITPDLRPDPRAALRDARIKGKLRKDLQDVARGSGLSLEDDTAEDPYADADGHTLKRHFSLLKSATDEVVLLQIEDWLANDGANVGAMDEMRDVFINRKVRIIAERVQTPSLSLEKTMPRIWYQKAMINAEFVSWRYVQELLEGKLSPTQVFGLATGGAPAKPAKATEKKTVKRVFISSTGLDLHDYREVARDVCIKASLLPIMMEHFEAMGLGATRGSKTKLDQADLYVGIFAHRYGFIESGYQTSVTEIEFDYAGERKLDRLCFVVDPTVPWPPSTWDPEHYKQMETFKKRIDRTLIRGQFKTCDDLKAQLTEALIPYR
jgi:hypothetical protein